MIPEGVENHLADSKADAENTDYEMTAKALSAIKKGLEISLSDSFKEIDYWKARCEAAEAVILYEQCPWSDHLAHWQELKQQSI